jgi:Skp family chaperone for outer membrane proteins
MRKFLLLIFLCSFTTAFSQTAKPAVTKTTIGYFNYDSLLVLIPGYKETADSVKTYRLEMVNKLAKEKAELARKQDESDSLSTVWSPLIRQLKQKELDDLKNNIKSDTKNLNAIDEVKLAPYEVKLTEASKKIALAKGYTATVDSKNSDDFVLWAAPGINFVNMTNDIYAELGISKTGK